MRTRRTQSVAAVVLALTAGGCGLSVPDIKEGWDGPRGTEQIEFEVKKQVYCHLKEAVAQAAQIPFYTEDRITGKRTRVPILPDDWGVQISLLLQVDESIGLNPGITLTDPIRNAVTPFSNGNVVTSQLFSLGLGGVLTSTASRIDRFDPYYSIAFLRRENTKDSVCLEGNDPFLKIGQRPASSSPLILSDLGIEKWLSEAMFTNSLLPSANPERSSNKDTPDTVSLEIKFVIVSSGSINPVWKLVRVTGNGSSAPLLASGRTRTHDLLITIGPPNDKTRNTHLSAQIGQSVGSNNLSNQVLR